MATRCPEATVRQRPSPAQLAAAAGRRVPDLISSGLRVLFCGINPSLYSAAVQHHFARPGNRFWRAIHRAGFTERVLMPSEENELLAHGVGLTNIVARATRSAAELSREDYRRGMASLGRRLERYQPEIVAFLGVGAYREATVRPEARVGEQPQRLAGARVWVLPNPSGLNAHYQLDGLAAAYAEMAREIGY